jgi:hypothetical protein
VDHFSKCPCVVEIVDLSQGYSYTDQHLINCIHERTLTD